MNYNFTNTKTRDRYKRKAEASFDTRFSLFLFKKVSENDNMSIAVEEFKEFRIEKNLKHLNQYIKVYWQREDNHTFKIGNKTIEKIYEEMRKWKKVHELEMSEYKHHYLEHVFPTVFTPEDFERFESGRAKAKCVYCGITENDIIRLIRNKKLNKKKDTRGWSLEIDRKKPNYEYSHKNSVWCCYWCNNSKTDEFSYEEFKKIGAVIQSIWDERLGR